MPKKEFDTPERVLDEMRAIYNDPDPDIATRLVATVIGPAMAVALLAGLWMVGQFGIGFTTLWIVWGLVAIVIFILIGVVATGRTAAELGSVARTSGPNDSRVAELQGRLRTLGILNILVLVSAVWAMMT